MKWPHVLLVFACGKQAPSNESPTSGDETGSQPPQEASVDTGDAPAEDSGNMETQTCPSLVLHEAGRFGLDELYASSMPPPPEVLGSCGWGLAVIDLNEDQQPDLLLAGAYDYTVPLVNASGTLSPNFDILFDDKYGLLPQGNGLAVGDLNGDQRPDFILTRSTGMSDRVYWNRGAGVFESMDLPDSMGESQTPSVFDADNDGDLDIFVARHIDLEDTIPAALDAGALRADINHLYINNAGTFSVAPSVGVADAASFQAAPFDADGDGDLDLFVVNDFGMFIAPNEMMLNDGSGRFAAATECGADVEMFGMGAAVSDANNDSIADIHVTDFGSPRLFFGSGEALFYDGTLASGAAVMPTERRVTSWGTTFVDLNLDGWDELATVFGPVQMGVSGDWSDQLSDPAVSDLDDSPLQADALFVNESGTFQEVSAALNFDHMDVGRAIVVADFNADGIPDLATSGMTAEMRPYIQLWLTSGGCGPGITVDFPAMSARDIGAKVEWMTGGQQRVRWFLPSTTYSSSGSTLHLGLEGAASAEWLRITPLGGEPIELVDVAAGSRVDYRSYQ